MQISHFHTPDAIATDAITTLSFDLDDTLWPISPTIQRAEEQTWQYMKTHYPNISRHYSQRGILELRNRIQQEYPEQSHDLTFLRKETFRRILSQSGYDESAKDELFEVYFSWRNKVRFFDDVPASLEYLSERYRLIAITNGNADAMATGIAQWFEHVIYAREVGVAKPNAVVFDYALEQAECQKGEIIHIGDHLRDDVLGALQYGIGAVWVNRFNEPLATRCPSDLVVVPDLNALCRLLG